MTPGGSMPSERPAAPPDAALPNGETARDPRAGDSDRPSSAPNNTNAGSGEAKSEPPTAEAKRGRFESRLPGLLRRGIEKSIEAGLYTFAKSLETGDAVRERLGDVKIPDV